RYDPPLPPSFITFQRHLQRLIQIGLLIGCPRRTEVEGPRPHQRVSTIQVPARPYSCAGHDRHPQLVPGRRRNQLHSFSSPKKVRLSKWSPVIFCILARASRLARLIFPCCRSIRAYLRGLSPE